MRQLTVVIYLVQPSRSISRLIKKHGFHRGHVAHKAHYQAIEKNAELWFQSKHPETDGQDKRSALNKLSSDIQKS